MKIKLKKLNDAAVLPSQATKGDFGYDVVATSEQEIAPGVWRYGLGFCYEIERDDIVLGSLEFTESEFDIEGRVIENKIYPWDYDNVTISIDFRPRSSVWKTGMVLSNCVGTLDEFYRGEVAAVFYHVKPDMPRYRVGDRIGQIKLGFSLPIEFEFVDEIDTNTERGTGGFGSTGLKSKGGQA